MPQMYNDSNIKIDRDSAGNLYMYCAYGDFPFYVTVGSYETIAGLIMKMNTRVYIYEDMRTYDYGTAKDNAHTVAHNIMSVINEKYVGKRGKRPAVSVDIIDGSTGVMVKRYSIINGKG